MADLARGGGVVAANCDKVVESCLFSRNILFYVVWNIGFNLTWLFWQHLVLSAEPLSALAEVVAILELVAGLKEEAGGVAQVEGEPKAGRGRLRVLKGNWISIGFLMICPLTWQSCKQPASSSIPSECRKRPWHSRPAWHWISVGNIFLSQWNVNKSFFTIAVNIRGVAELAVFIVQLLAFSEAQAVSLFLVIGDDTAATGFLAQFHTLLETFDGLPLLDYKRASALSR